LVRYGNPQALYIQALITVGGLALGMVLSIPTGVIQQLGIFYSLLLALAVLLLLNIGFSFVVFTSVDIEPGRVTLMNAFLRKVVVPAEAVDQVELVPPVHTTSLKWTWTDRQSMLSIHRKGRNTIRTSAMPEGLKLLIARALDPAHYAVEYAPGALPKGPPPEK